MTSAVHGREPLPTLDSHEVQEVRRELCVIRDKVNTILDSLDGKLGGATRGTRGGSTLSPPLPSSSTTQPEPTSTKTKGKTKMLVS